MYLLYLCEALRSLRVLGAITSVCLLLLLLLLLNGDVDAIKNAGHVTMAPSMLHSYNMI